MKNATVHKLSDVYGVSRDVPLTYCEREDVDRKLRNSIDRDKHIVIFGGSKQGKTCLRKHVLGSDRYIVVQCLSGMGTQELYSAVLKEAGARVEVLERKGTSGGYKVALEFDASGKIPLVAEVKGAVKGERAGSKQSEVETRSLEIEPADPNDVIRALRDMQFDKYIVLEDFHSLPEETQKQVASDLKAYHEKSNLCFIVVGVWLESNRLVLYNGDLFGRLIPIDADRWEPDELRAVIEVGKPLMNIEVDDEVASRVVSSCQGNVGVLQETMYRVCERADLLATSKETARIGSVGEVDAVIRGIAVEQAGRYRTFLAQFVEGFQPTELDMYRWIGYVLVTAEPSALKGGLRANVIHHEIERIHPHAERLQLNNTFQALKRVSKIQQNHDVHPIILNFDSDQNVLQIVDSGFILFVVATPRSELLEAIGVDPRM